MSDDGHAHSVSRRRFVRAVAGAGGGIVAALVGLPAIGYIVSPAVRRASRDEWATVGPVSDLAPGEPTYFSIVRTRKVGWETTATPYGLYVALLPDGQLGVFSNRCTHLGCSVTWRSDLYEFVCPCHGGRFASDGSIVTGPQPRPLDRHDYRIEGGAIQVRLVDA